MRVGLKRQAFSLTNHTPDRFGLFVRIDGNHSPNNPGMPPSPAVLGAELTFSLSASMSIPIVSISALHFEYAMDDSCPACKCVMSMNNVGMEMNDEAKNVFIRDRRAQVAGGQRRTLDEHEHSPISRRKRRIIAVHIRASGLILRANRRESHRQIARGIPEGKRQPERQRFQKKKLTQLRILLYIRSI